MALTWYVGVDWGVNLCLNPGFETLGAGPTTDIFANWGEVESAVADEGTSVHGGSHACKITDISGTVTWVSQGISVTAGTYYQVSFWTRGDGTSAGSYTIQKTTGITSNEYLIPWQTTTGVSGTAYKKVRGIFRIPTGWTGISLYLFSPASGSAYYDDVVVSQYVPEEDYVTASDIQRGRRSVFERFEPGKLRLTLNNASQRFDPWYASGALYGYLKPGKSVLVAMNDLTFTEKVTNGNMSTGNPPSNWTGVNATLASGSGVGAYDGNYLAVTATSDGGYAYCDTFTVEPGRWYHFQGVYRYGSALRPEATARFRIRDVTNNADIYMGTYATGVWKLVTQDFRAPVGCVGVRIFCQVETNTDVVWFDGVSVTDTYAPLFYGTITDMRPTGGKGKQEVVVDAVDGLQAMAAKQVYSDYRASGTTDVCVEDILDDVGWLDNTDWRDMDTGDVTVGSFWGGGSALDVINQLADAEHGAFYIAADGGATFLDRTAYIGTTAVGALDEDDITDIMLTQPWDHIRNEIVVKGNIVKAWASTTEHAGNGTMETGSPPGGWTATNATLARYTSSVHGGSAALSVAATSNAGYAYQQLSGFTVGESVTFSGWMRSSAAGHRCRFVVRDFNNATDLYAGAYTDNTSYNQQTNTFTIPSGCITIRVWCQVESISETAYFDDITVTAVGREIFNYEEVPSIAAGSSITLWAEYQDENGNRCPAKNVRTPIAYLDYTANAAADGSGTDMTSSMEVSLSKHSTTARLVVNNVHATTTLYVTKLALRGYSLRLRPIQVKVEDTASQEAYGKHTLMVDTPYLQTQAAANTLATNLETYYDDPLKAPTVRMEMKFPEMVSFDLQENITFTAPTYTINEVERIGYIHHWTGETPQSLFTEWTFEPVPS